MSNGEKQKPESAGTVSEVMFAFLNEISIISQLSAALLARTLPDGIHPSHFGVLNHLGRTGDGKTPVQIASAMQVTKATMTHTLKVLEERGLIDIKPNPEDARGKLVFLTDAGHAFRDDAVIKLGQGFGHLETEAYREMAQRLLPDLTAFRKHLDNNR